MEKLSTSQRLKYYMQVTGIKQKDILDKAEPFSKKYNIKLNKNDLSQYVSGKVEPGNKKLTILAKALNVNPVWLMGYDVPMAAELKTDSKSEILIEKINKLDEEQKDAIINIIDNMK